MMYYISQLFVIISYVFLGVTYCIKNRRDVLIYSFLSLVASVVGFVLLNAWSGCFMVVVAIVRNIIFMIQDKKGDKDKITRIDWMILCFLYLISICVAIFTYEGLFSLLSVMGTMIYTYSVWQKNTKIYKILGVPSSISWVLYSVFVKSIFGVVLESLLLVVEVLSIIKYFKKEKRTEV